MINKNQATADRLNTMDLSQKALDIIHDTDFNLLDEIFGKLETAEQVEQFINEVYTD